jgi:hypothetical protein
MLNADVVLIEQDAVAAIAVNDVVADRAKEIERNPIR